MRAGKHRGVEVHVTPVPDLDTVRLGDMGPSPIVGSATIGRVQPVEDQARLFDARRTSRIPYDGRSVDEAVLSEFADVAVRFGQRFHVVSDPKTVSDVLRLNVDAIVDNLRFDDEREEIRAWYRTGETPEYGDGLWEGPMNQRAWEIRAAFGAHRIFRLPGLRALAAHRYLRTQQGTPHIGLLCGPFDRWFDLVRAGEQLFELWLTMTKHAVYMQPMGSMLTNPKYARIIAQRFQMQDCWLVFRFGHSGIPPRAPRLGTIVEIP
jgi:hypothetical protein